MKRRAYQIHLDYSMQSPHNHNMDQKQRCKTSEVTQWKEALFLWYERTPLREQTLPLKLWKSQVGAESPQDLVFPVCTAIQETCIKTLNVWMQNWKRAQVQEPGTGTNNQTCQARKQTAPHASYWLNHLDPVLLSVNAAERILWLSSPGERHKLPVFSWSHHAMHKMMLDLTASFELVIPLRMKMFSIKT